MLLPNLKHGWVLGIHRNPPQLGFLNSLEDFQKCNKFHLRSYTGSYIEDFDADWLDHYSISLPNAIDAYLVIRLVQHWHGLNYCPTFIRSGTDFRPPHLSLLIRFAVLGSRKDSALCDGSPVSEEQAWQTRCVGECDLPPSSHNRRRCSQIWDLSSSRPFLRMVPLLSGLLIACAKRRWVESSLARRRRRLMTPGPLSLAKV